MSPTNFAKVCDRRNPRRRAVPHTVLRRVSFGRSQFAVAYISPDKPASVEELDAVRSSVSQSTLDVHSPSRIEVIFTGKYPYS